MSIALAFLISAGVHLAALLSPAWELPDLNTTDASTRLDAIIMPPTPHPQIAAAAVPKPPPRRAPKRRAAQTAPEAPATALATAPEAAVNEEPAVSPTPTISPAEETAAQPAPAEPSPATPQIKLDGFPGEGRLRFIITRGIGGLIVGQNVYAWKHDGSTYTTQSVTETTGLVALFKSVRVVQESRGEITPAGLRPLEFSSEGKRSDAAAHFNWETRTLSYAGHADPLPEGTQDMLSMYHQLVLLLASANPPNPLELPIATGRKLEHYRFELLGEEPLDYQGAPHAALHLKTRNGDDIIEIWIARDVPGLPIKIRFTDRKGEVFEQIAEEMALVRHNETR